MLRAGDRGATLAEAGGVGLRGHIEGAAFGARKTTPRFEWIAFGGAHLMGKCPSACIDVRLGGRPLLPGLSPHANGDCLRSLSWRAGIVARTARRNCAAPDYVSRWTGSTMANRATVITFVNTVVGMALIAVAFYLVHVAVRRFF